MWKKKSKKKDKTLWFNEILDHASDKDIAKAFISLYANRDILFSKQRPQDSDYGYSLGNPIMTSSIDASNEYLKKLRSSYGQEFTWERNGSYCVNVHGVQNVMIDEYDLLLEGKTYKTIYICPYGRDANYVPEGLQVEGSSKQSTQENNKMPYEVNKDDQKESLYKRARHISSLLLNVGWDVKFDYPQNNSVVADDSPSNTPRFDISEIKLSLTPIPDKKTKEEEDRKALLPIVCHPEFTFINYNGYVMGAYESSSRTRLAGITSLVDIYFSEVKTPSQTVPFHVLRQYRLDADRMPNDLEVINIDFRVLDPSRWMFVTVKDMIVGIADDQGKQICQYNLDEEITSYSKVEMLRLKRNKDEWEVEAIGKIKEMKKL